MLVFDDDDGDNDGDYVLDRLAGLYGKQKKKGKVERERWIVYIERTQEEEKKKDRTCSKTDLFDELLSFSSLQRAYV